MNFLSVTNYAAQHIKYQSLSAKCKHRIAMKAQPGRDHRKAWLYEIGAIGAWGVLKDELRDVFFFEREEDLMLFKLTWAEEEVQMPPTLYSNYVFGSHGP